MKRFLILLPVILLAAFLFHPLFDGGFARDDYVILRLIEFGTVEPLEDEVTPEITLLDLFFLEPLEGYSLYRPLVLASFLLCTKAFGLHPGGHILVTLLLHFTNALLVFMVIKRLWPQHFLARMVGASLFAFHPIQVQVAAWSSARSDSLSFLFGLTAVLIKMRGPGHRVLPALLLFSAFLCKESALVWVIPVMALDVHRAWGESTDSRMWQRIPWRRLLHPAAAVLLFFTLRAVAFGDADADTYGGFVLWEHFPTRFARNWGSVLLFLLCPLVPQAPTPGAPLVSFQLAHIIASLGLLVVGLRSLASLGRLQMVLWGALVISAAPAFLVHQSVVTFDWSRSFYTPMLTWAVVVGGAVARRPRLGGALACLLILTSLPSTRYLVDRWQRGSRQVERAVASARDIFAASPAGFPDHVVILGYRPPPITREGMVSGIYPVMFRRPSMPRDMKFDVIPAAPTARVPSPGRALQRAVQHASHETRYLSLGGPRDDWLFRLVHPPGDTVDGSFPVEPLSPESGECLLSVEGSGASQTFEIGHPEGEGLHYILTMVSPQGHRFDVPVAVLGRRPGGKGSVRVKLGPVVFPASVLEAAKTGLDLAWSVSVLKKRKPLGRTAMRYMLVAARSGTLR